MSRLDSFIRRLEAQRACLNTAPALIEGIRPISPLDVLDLVLLHRKAGAFILDTWTL